MNCAAVSRRSMNCISVTCRYMNCIQVEPAVSESKARTRRQGTKRAVLEDPRSVPPLGVALQHAHSRVAEQACSKWHSTRVGR
eukprot:610490-Rhodomonas_salina.1